jgi:hypothetical protein
MVVMTIVGLLVLLQVALRPCTLLLPATTTGVIDGAKNPEGVTSEIAPPIGMGVNGLKDRVTGTFVLPLSLCDEAIPKTTPETWPLIAPDDMAAEGSSSEDVCNVTSPPRVTAPITNPDIVTTNPLELMAAPAVVMTIDEAITGPHVAVSDAMLLFPAVMIGVAS